MKTGNWESVHANHNIFVIPGLSAGVSRTEPGIGLNLPVNRFRVPRFARPRNDEQKTFGA